MIIDLGKFIARERPYWDELEGMVAKVEAEPIWRLGLDQAKRLHYLYERASAAPARTNTFSSDPDMRRYLESLVARTYGVIHTLPRRRRRFRPLRWFLGTFPRTFRRHIRAFALAVAVTLAGSAFGAHPNRRVAHALAAATVQAVAGHYRASFHSKKTPNSLSMEKVSLKVTLNWLQTSGSRTRFRDSGRGCSFVTTIVLLVIAYATSQPSASVANFALAWSRYCALRCTQSMTSE